MSETDGICSTSSSMLRPRSATREPTGEVGGRTRRLSMPSSCASRRSASPQARRRPRRWRRFPTSSGATSRDPRQDRPRVQGDRRPHHPWRGRSPVAPAHHRREPCARRAQAVRSSEPPASRLSHVRAGVRRAARERAGLDGGGWGVGVSAPQSGADWYAGTDARFRRSRARPSVRRA